MCASIERKFQDSNYSGTISIWDILFGTFNHPDKYVGETALMPMGIKEQYVSDKLLKQFYLPLTWQVKAPTVRAQETVREG